MKSIIKFITVIGVILTSPAIVMSQPIPPAPQSPIGSGLLLLVLGAVSYQLIKKKKRG